MVSMRQWVWAQPGQLGQFSGLQPKSIQVAGTTQFHMAGTLVPDWLSAEATLALCLLSQAATVGGALSPVNPPNLFSSFPILGSTLLSEFFSTPKLR